MHCDTVGQYQCLKLADTFAFCIYVYIVFMFLFVPLFAEEKTKLQLIKV